MLAVSDIIRMIYYLGCCVIKSGEKLLSQKRSLYVEPSLQNAFVLERILMERRKPLRKKKFAALRHIAD
jgi:hypothetical protein